MNYKKNELHVEYRENEIVVSKLGFPTHTFTLIDHIPPGYMIWNISKSAMPEGYLPLCRLSYYQPFPGGRDIETDTLKALKVEGSGVILDAIGFGPKTPEEMERHIEKHSKEGTHTMEIERMKKALPFMKKINWR